MYEVIRVIGLRLKFNYLMYALEIKARPTPIIEPATILPSKKPKPTPKTQRPTNKKFPLVPKLFSSIG